jgi:hypothetical protein
LTRFPALAVCGPLLGNYILGSNALIVPAVAGLVAVGILHHKFSKWSVLQQGLVDYNFGPSRWSARTIHHSGVMNVPERVLVDDAPDHPYGIVKSVGFVDVYRGIKKCIVDWDRYARKYSFGCLRGIVVLKKWLPLRDFLGCFATYVAEPEWRRTRRMPDFEKFEFAMCRRGAEIFQGTREVEVDFNQFCLPFWAADCRISDGKRWRSQESQFLAYAYPGSAGASHLFPLLFRVCDIVVSEYNYCNGSESGDGSIVRVSESKADRDRLPDSSWESPEPNANCFQTPHDILAVLVSLAGFLCLGLALGFLQRAAALLVDAGTRRFYIGLASLVVCLFFVYQAFNPSLFGVAPCAMGSRIQFFRDRDGLSSCQT